MKRKIALFCNIGEDAVISAKDVDTIYDVPLHLSAEGIDEIIVKLLDLPLPQEATCDRLGTRWCDQIKHPQQEVTHRHRRQVRLLRGFVQVAQRKRCCTGGVASNLKVNLEWIEAEEMVNGKLREALDRVDAHPGARAASEIRGVKGMIEAVRYAREEGRSRTWGSVSACSARSSRRRATSAACPGRGFHGVQRGSAKEAGDLQVARSARRRGDGRNHASRSLSRPNLAVRLVRPPRVRYQDHFRTPPAPVRGQPGIQGSSSRSAAGLKISGLSPDGKFVEIIEHADHPWFLACQFHPEYKSRPLARAPPVPRFRGRRLSQSRSARTGRDGNVDTDGCLSPRD